MLELNNHFTQYGKSHTWAEIADMYNILPNGSRKQRADKVRKYYNRVYLKSNTKIQPQQASLLDDFREFLKSKQKSNVKPYLNGDPNNILVIGDSHIPFEHPDYLSFCLDIQRKYNCGKVIHIGDILDFNSTTYHTLIPELLSPAYEFEYSKIKLQDWYKAFPDLTITLGNHDRRIARKMRDGSISNSWQKSIADVMEVPNWNFVPDYVYNNIYFCHGEGATASVTALQKQMSTVQGHRHSETYINFPAKSLFAVQTALGIDRSSLAFDYAKVDPKEWTLGVTVIINNQTPIIERL